MRIVKLILYTFGFVSEIATIVVAFLWLKNGQSQYEPFTIILGAIGGILFVVAGLKFPTTTKSPSNEKPESYTTPKKFLFDVKPTETFIHDEPNIMISVKSISVSGKYVSVGNPIASFEYRLPGRNNTAASAHIGWFVTFEHQKIKYTLTLIQITASFIRFDLRANK